MSKNLRTILIVICIWIFIFLVDFICIKNIDRPIFMIRIYMHKDGGSKEYYGLGYKVIDYNVIDGDSSIHMGTWFMKYNPIKTAILTDNAKFYKEYNKVGINNVFTYRSVDEIINILRNGTGIIYLGFPECPWCQAYVPMLNEIAVSKKLDKIYYFNILENRKNNTDAYKEIVSMLSDYLKYDDEGNKRVYVPAVIAVNNGIIVGFDDETSYDTKEIDNPDEYWTDEEVSGLKIKLSTMIESVLSNKCTSCNK